MTNNSLLKLFEDLNNFNKQLNATTAPITKFQKALNQNTNSILKVNSEMNNLSKGFVSLNNTLSKISIIKPVQPIYIPKERDKVDNAKDKFNKITKITKGVALGVGVLKFGMAIFNFITALDRLAIGRAEVRNRKGKLSSFDRKNIRSEAYETTRVKEYGNEDFINKINQEIRANQDRYPNAKFETITYSDDHKANADAVEKYFAQIEQYNNRAYNRGKSLPPIQSQYKTNITSTQTYHDKKQTLRDDKITELNQPRLTPSDIIPATNYTAGYLKIKEIAPTIRIKINAGGKKPLTKEEIEKMMLAMIKSQANVDLIQDVLCETAKYAARQVKDIYSYVPE